MSDTQCPTIRLSTRGDAVAIAAIYAPFCESTPVSFEYEAPSTEEMAQRIESITSRFPWLVLDDGRTIAGYAYASPHRERAAYGWSVDATVYVSRDYRRCGVGRALYTTLFALLRLRGYFKAYAGVTLPNPASVRLHEAVGFEPVGIYRGVGYKHGAWHDVGWYQLELQPERANPPPPAPTNTTEEWFEAVTRGLRHYCAR